jgi:hypothetical protein
MSMPTSAEIGSSSASAARKGRSGEYRTVIAYHANARSIFLYEFAKKDREDIDTTDLESLKSLAKHLLMSSDAGIESALAENELTEVHDDDDDEREIS